MHSTRTWLASIVFGCVIGFVGIPICAGAEANDQPSIEYVVDGSTIHVRIWNDAADDDEPGRTRTSIALDGVNWSRPRVADTVLHLRYAEFDPLNGAPAVHESLQQQVFEAVDEPLLSIVQFHTQPLDAYRTQIEEAGGVIRRFVPGNAWIVEMTPTMRAQVAEQSFVRWVGEFEPAYRLEDELLDAVVADRGSARRVNIMVFDPKQKTTLARRVVEFGGVINTPNAGKHLIEATLTPMQLRAIVHWNEVLFVDRWSPMTTDMDLAREISGANYVETFGGYSGNGVRGEVIDVGFNLSHVDFQSRPLILHTPANSDSHGAATSGIIFGDGTANPMARGLLPHGQGIVADWDEVSVGQARYDHTGELTQPPYEAVFQSSSVGSLQVTNYTTISADTDAALFDFDILHCQSQSNLGNQSSRPQAWAKNIVSVGGIRHMNTLSKDDDCWGCESSAASIGPSVEGRIKPDLSHFYDNIFTVTTGSDTEYTLTFGGTSGATPIVAGYFGLFFEMWADGIFGNIVDPDATVFENRPHMTTAKAMLINSASQYAFDGAGHDLTRVHQGWGMPSLQMLYDGRQNMMIIDETDLLTNLASVVYAVNVQPDEPALRVTMVYADPPGNPSVVVARVNDLTLRVTAPDGTMYWGNNGLLEGNWSTAGGESNTVDTVENVFIADPIPGQWTIEVIADEIIEDAHVETPGLDADFSLVVAGVDPVVPALAIQLPSGIPSLVPPGQPFDVPVRVLDGGEVVVPESVTAFYRFDSQSSFVATPVAHLGGPDYLLTIPAPDCGDTPEFYVTADGDGGTVVSSPALAPDAVYTTSIGIINTILEDSFETDLGWAVENDVNLVDGQWERGEPIGGGDRGDPAVDFDGSGQCFLTDNVDDNSDVDGGITWLISPTIDLSDGDAMIEFALWYTNNFGADPNNDLFNIDLSNDDGGTWTTALTVGPGTSNGWSTYSIPVGDTVTPNDQVRVRFEASDLNAGSVVEAGIDAFAVRRIECGASCVGDANNDDTVDVLDLLGLLSAWGTADGSYDIVPEGGDGNVDVLDLLALLALWGPCSP